MSFKEIVRKHWRYIVVSLALLVGISLLSQSVFASVGASKIQAAVPANHTLAGDPKVAVSDSEFLAPTSHLSHVSNYGSIAGIAGIAARGFAPFTWLDKAPLPTHRSRLAVAGTGSSLFAIGGENWTGSVYNTLTAAVERYDATSDTYTTLAPLPVPLSNIEACAMGGKIYVPGGYAGRHVLSDGTLYIYDIANDSWSTGPAVPSPRIWYSAICDPSGGTNGKLYVIGGYGSGGSNLNSIYDVASGSWSSGASMPDYHYGSEGALIGSYIYIALGASTELLRYDIAGNSWSTMASAPAGSKGLYGSSGVGPDGAFYIAGGGFDGDYFSGGFTYLSRVLRYDPSSDSWGLLDPLNVPVSYSNGGFANGHMYAIGGETLSGSNARCPGNAGVGVCDYTQQLGSALTSTPTSTPAGSVTPSPAMLVGHVSWWRGIQPISLTLTMGGTQIDYLTQNTDASGFFTVSVEGLASGTYNYRAKGPKYLANAGTVTLTGAPITQLEIGYLPQGDAYNDNVLDAIDFSILKASFGTACGPLYDARADFDNNCVVNAMDFSVTKHYFGMLGAPPDSAAPLSSGNAFLSLQPGSAGNCSAPPNGGTVPLGCRFVLDMMVNMGSVPDGVAMQSYMTFTSSILQNARVDAIASSCVPTNTVTQDLTTFDATVQLEVCDGPAPCTFRGMTVDAGSFAYALGALVSPPSGGTFRVARIGLCAVAPGQAVLRWQFSPPSQRNRHTAIVDVDGNMVQDQSLFTDYVINIPPCPTCTNTPTPTITPTNTPTRTRTFTRTPTNTPLCAPNCTPTPTITPTFTRTVTPTPSNTPLCAPNCTATPTITRTPTRTFTPGVCNNEPVQFLQPEAGAPPNGGTVNVGDRFVLDLMVNARDFAAPNGLTAQQSYMTFTADLLQNARVSDIGTSCVPTGTVTGDTSVFDSSLQNEVCNGPGQCTLRGVLVAPGSIAYASGGLTNCPQGCPDPAEPPPLNQPVFRVAQIGLCAMAPGQAIIRWEFSPPSPNTRDTEIVAANASVVNNRACYTNYVINVVAPTNTPTITPTPTPDARLVGHVTNEGRPAQPNALQSVPITFTLKVSGGGPENDYSTNTDASGYFTITSPGPGFYNWRVKNPQTLANSGSVTLPSSGPTQQEMGLLRQGDANNDNCTSALDFIIVRNSFGKAVGDPGYDPRADFNGDNLVSTSDFTLLRGTFGQCGAGPIGPIRPAP